MGEDVNELDEEKLESTYDWKLLKRLWKYAMKYWKLFLLALLMLFASTVADIIRPYLVKIAIDDYLDVFGKPMAIAVEQQKEGIGHIGLLFLAAILAGFIFNYFQIYLLSYSSQGIIYDIRQQVFAHIQKLPLSFFDKTPLGRLVTRVTNDTEALNEMYTNVLVSLLKDISIFIGAVILMFILSPYLTMLVLLSMPFIVIATVYFRKKAREVYRRVRTTLAKINSAISENLSGMRVIQIFGRDKEKLNEFDSINRKYLSAGMAEIKVFGMFRPVIEMISSFVVAVLIWFGGARVIGGTLEFGVLFALINYVTILFQPINDLSEKFNILQSAIAASERIFGVLDTPVEVDMGKTVSTEIFHESIQFEDVWFAYNEEEWVLKDLKFTVNPGETVAIVGATGAGKTSIVGLLGRFYEYQKGRILVNNTDIKQISKSSLRQSVAFVPQDVFLFNGTIIDNIRLNRTDIPLERIEDICKYINAHDFIAKLPNGYNEIVGERGAGISTGQRQLLAFARALLLNPSILVLDEATANIDTETELVIQDALSKLKKGRTTIAIAHRLSTIKNADRIVVLHKGRIKEMGTHQNLLEQKGLYYNLYELQYNRG